MVKNLNKYGQYKNDFFNKLGIVFEPRKKILDVGCGDGTDAKIFIKEYKLNTYGVDVYKHTNISKIAGLKYKKASIYDLPFSTDTFDYVFLHDVLHHVDEEGQRTENHIKALKEVKRVAKKGGRIIIVEGNRYNPLFYPHMVKMLKHEHFVQSYFHKIINTVFKKTTFNYFEAHFYPARVLKSFKIYEYIMEKLSPKKFLAYNVADIIK